MARLAKGLRAVLERLSCPSDAELSVVLTDNSDIADLNERYLGRRKDPPMCWPFPWARGISRM